MRLEGGTDLGGQLLRSIKFSVAKEGMLLPRVRSSVFCVMQQAVDLWIFFFSPTLALCPGWSSKHKAPPHPPLCLHSNPGLTSKTSSCPHHPVFLLKDPNSYWTAPSVINTWLSPSFSLIYMYVSSLQSENSLRTRITQYLVQCQVHSKN